MVIITKLQCQITYYKILQKFCISNFSSYWKKLPLISKRNRLLNNFSKVSGINCCQRTILFYPKIARSKLRAKIYQCNSAMRKLNGSFGLLLVCPQMLFRSAIVFVKHANEAGQAASGVQARSQKKNWKICLICLSPAPPPFILAHSSHTRLIFC